MACAERFDGLLLPGGGDIHPSYFDQIDRYSAGIEVQLDRMQFYLAEAFAAAEKPILGICKGMQLLNVLFGGDLYQELPAGQKEIHDYNKELEQDRWHASWISREFFSAVQPEVEKVQPESEKAQPESEKFQPEVEKAQSESEKVQPEEWEMESPVFLQVNSAHHQAVHRLGDGFEVIQRAEDGVAEGIWHKSLPIVGFQWHPERCPAREAAQLFQFTWKFLFHK